MSGFGRRLLFLLSLALFVDVDPTTILLQGSAMTDAQARIGRPATPGSVAGVARRTTRRAWRRTGRYVAALPGGCGRVTLYGAVVWNCAGVYYQPYGNRYVVIVID